MDREYTLEQVKNIPARLALFLLTWIVGELAQAPNRNPTFRFEFVQDGRQHHIFGTFFRRLNQVQITITREVGTEWMNKSQSSTISTNELHHEIPTDDPVLGQVAKFFKVALEQFEPMRDLYTPGLPPLPVSIYLVLNNRIIMGFGLDVTGDRAMDYDVATLVSKGTKRLVIPHYDPERPNRTKVVYIQDRNAMYLVYVVLDNLALTHTPNWQDWTPKPTPQQSGKIGLGQTMFVPKAGDKFDTF